MFCNKCGKENPSGATYCNSCGGAVSGNTKSKGDNKNLMIIIVALVSVLVILIGAAVFLFLSKSSSDAGIGSKQETNSSLTGESNSSSSNTSSNTDDIYYEFISNLMSVVDQSGYDYSQMGLPDYLRYTVGSNAQSLAYALIDLDGDGTNELLISNEVDNFYVGSISSLYGIVDGKVTPIVNSEERVSVRLLSDLSLGIDGSSGYNDSSWGNFKFNNNKLVQVSEYVFQPINESDPHNSAWFGVPYNGGEFRYDQTYQLGDQEETQFYNKQSDQYAIKYSLCSSIGTTQVQTTSSSSVIDFDELVRTGQAIHGYGYLYEDLGLDDVYNGRGGPAYAMIGSSTDSLLYYGGYGFLYWVVNNSVYVSYPSCEYAFDLGNILSPNYNSGDVIVLDGTEHILDAVARNELADDKLSLYKNSTNLLTGMECYTKLENWIDTHTFPVIVFPGTWTSETEFALYGGDTIPYIVTDFSYILNNEDIFIDTLINRIDGSILVLVNGGDYISIDTWYNSNF